MIFGKLMYMVTSEALQFLHLLIKSNNRFRNRETTMVGAPDPAENSEHLPVRAETKGAPVTTLAAKSAG